MIERDVILDLLPLYRAGLGSPATRALVETYLRDHPELPERGYDKAEPSDDSFMLDAMQRARRVSRWRRRLYAFAIAFTAIFFALDIRATPGSFHIRLLAMEYPAQFAPIGLAALAAWASYAWIVRSR